LSTRLSVLEIGSGHNPHPYSSVLIDKYLDAREREGALVRDRPFVLADAHNLPFRDHCFDVAIARQVLEHADDPVRFVSEMSRVGRRCRIETPSPLTETMFRVRSFHRWAVDLDGDGLVYWPIDLVEKSETNGSVFEMLYERNAFVYMLIRGRPDVFFTTFDGPAPSIRQGTAGQLRESVERSLLKLTSGSRIRQLSWLGAAVSGLVRSQWEKTRFARRQYVLFSGSRKPRRSTAGSRGAQ
jgi:SAM-dependent methyltransferase